MSADTEGSPSRALKLLAVVQTQSVVLGMQELLEAAPPKAIMLELYPHSMPGGPAEATLLLRQLYNMGYTVMSHSGLGKSAAMTACHVLPQLKLLQELLACSTTQHPCPRACHP